ncbi:MAG: NADH-quinone oxidoreductase subunit G, partial [Alphaproteobacteria bacterium]|nr:NADH-quinone oxidoreductase subunit G [Alphaproteobacteria bacterium]
IEIPRFCYHDKLSIAENCNMCLVELEGEPEKLLPSCTLECTDGMVIRTDSDMVKKERRKIIEIMLANHPIDCHICDQGGECDLQDQAVAYGFDRSSYHENKRTVTDKRTIQDKNSGPLISTAMARCINCTRCIRFLDEIAGTPAPEQIDEGKETETYVPDIIHSELSGNLIDICPVGALTSKPYKFKARRWELRKTESIDVHDALGCNIRIDSRGREVMRILPRLNEDINETWIDDRTRFSCDGLAHKRLDRPYIRDKKSGKLIEASWEEAFRFIANTLRELQSHEIAALAGDMADVESMTALKDLMIELGSGHMDCRTDGSQMNNADRGSYLFNSTIAGIDEADAIILIGVNPRRDGTMVNARIRRNWLEKGIPVYLIGQPADLTYPYKHLGTNPKDIETLIKNKLKTEKPMIIVGMDAFIREDTLAIHALLHKCAKALGVIKTGWNGFNILHKAASRVGGLDIGFLPQLEKNGKRFTEIIAGTKDGSIKALYLMGADEFNASVNIGWQTFVIYQGHHGDHGAERADVILPAAAYTEKDGTYVNTEGRPQLAQQAVSPPGQARADWKIIRVLSEYILPEPLPYNTFAELQKRIKREWPVFKATYQITPSKWVLYKHKGKIHKEDFAPSRQNYYLNDAICRASPTMHSCVESFGDVGLVKPDTDWHSLNENWYKDCDCNPARKRGACVAYERLSSNDDKTV